MKETKEKAVSNIAISNETDLDWLARNVHVWNKSAYAAIFCGVERVLWISGAACGKKAELKNAVTKDQWLARRAELQNKPSWKDAPEWAQWLAKDSPDKDGESAWWWYADKPVDMKNTWQVSTEGRAMMASSCHCDLGNWRDTLERRPEHTCAEMEVEFVKWLFRPFFKPFNSIEDNQELNMTQQQEVKQDNGWFERGELPPVGILCLYVVSDRLSEEVEITAHAKLGLCFVRVGQSGESYVSKTAELHRFLPIRTEREQLTSIIDGGKRVLATPEAIADAILSVGFSLRAK